MVAQKEDRTSVIGVQYISNLHLNSKYKEVFFKELFFRAGGFLGRTDRNKQFY